MLGAFLFRGEEVDKKVKVLSGGERNRLALCKMLLNPFNVLIMDEPTNHLDIASKNVLKYALSQFEGTLLLVSHDRDFLQGLTHKVYEFKNRKIKEYLGDIDYFLSEREVENLREIEKKTTVKNTSDKSKSNNEYLNSKEREKECRKLKNRLSKVEKMIENLEEIIASYEEKIAENSSEITENQNFFTEYQSKKNELNSCMEEWEELHEKCEECL